MQPFFARAFRDPVDLFNNGEAKGLLALLNHGMKIDKLEIPKMF